MSVRRPSRVSGPPKAIVAALLALGLLGLFAPIASAAEQTYIVDGKGDASGGACVTATPADCTLRSAIELANASAGEHDLIGFDGAIFNGEATDTVTLASALPAITSPLTLNGSHSCVIGVLTGPCVGVAASSTSASVLTVEDADNVTINGLALTGGQTGINVIDSSQFVTITGNWIGVKLDTSAGGNLGAGIFIDPDSNGAVIGGTDAGSQNVISNNGTGLDILGADNATIRGNFFGVNTERPGRGRKHHQGHRDHRLDRRRRLQSPEQRNRRRPAESRSADNRTATRAAT